MKQIFELIRGILGTEASVYQLYGQCIGHSDAAGIRPGVAGYRDVDRK